MNSGRKGFIVDLSAPHNNSGHPSMNDLIDKEQCSLSYVKIDDAIRAIKDMGKGAKMCKLDIKNAFKIMPIRPSQMPYFMIKWRNSYYVYTRLVFGSRSSPKIFDNLSRAICWIATNNYGIHTIFHLLDDFLTVQEPHTDGDRTMALLTLIFNKLCVPLSTSKTAGPTTVLEYLGVILDSDKLEARLPRDKVERIISFIDSLILKKACSKREVLQILGHFNFASRVILPGRSFVSYLIQLSTTVSELHHYVHLTRSCIEDLKLWRRFLDSWNGVSMFYEDVYVSSDDMQLYTDASSTLGFSAFYKNQWFCQPWPEAMPDKTSMAYMELYPIVAVAVQWSHNWTCKKDNFSSATMKLQLAF